MDTQSKTGILYSPNADTINVLLETREAEETRQTDEDLGHGGDDQSGGKERDTWSSKKEYLLSAIGYTVGVGNIWRFPYMCNRNGGGAFLLPFLISLLLFGLPINFLEMALGAFLLPFLISLLLFGLPINFLEMALGQFTGKSPLQVWNICPLFKGVGISLFILAAITYWCFNTLLTWTLYYLVSSFKSELPWSLCGQWWNTPNCRGRSRADNKSSPCDQWNITLEGNSTTNGSLLKPVTAAEEFWQNNVLRVSSGLYDMGHLVWPLALAQCVVVFLLFLALLKGIKSSGKVVYVTATAPYLLLTVLLVRGATLPGAGEGILFYITPDFERLADPKVWIEAALQVFYSLGAAWGPMITLASYNKFNNNCFRDAVLVTLVGEGTSVFGGFTIFSVLGYMAHTAGVSIDQIVSSGPGLAFIVYPEAVSLMPLPQLWAVLFFLTLVTVVTDTQLATGETALTILCDQFPNSLGRRRVLVTAALSVTLLLLSLPLVTQGGVYIFQLSDWFFASYTVAVVALLECVVIAWIYGADHFGQDIQLMTGQKPPIFIKILWAFVMPVLVLVLLVFTLAEYKPPTYGDYHYDTLAAVIGWMIASVSFIPIPVVAGWKLHRARGSFIQRLKQTTTPSKEWGPADPARRRSYQKQKMGRTPRQSWLDVIRN